MTRLFSQALNFKYSERMARHRIVKFIGHDDRPGWFHPSQTEVVGTIECNLGVVIGSLQSLPPEVQPKY
jgi:hypothetical protein